MKCLSIKLLGWSFVALDANGRSWGLVMGLQGQQYKTLELLGIIFGFNGGGVSYDLCTNLTLVKVYGPYQERVHFWNNLFSKSLLNNSKVVVGGDLNVSLGLSTSWGPLAQGNLFMGKFINVDLIKDKPTWRNKRVGEARVAKHLEHFLKKEDLAAQNSSFRQWVGFSMESDHFPIYLELKGASKKPGSPFKFNSSWLKNQTYNKLVRLIWRPRVKSQAMHLLSPLWKT